MDMTPYNKIDMEQDDLHEKVAQYAQEKGLRADEAQCVELAARGMSVKDAIRVSYDGTKNAKPPSNRRISKHVREFSLRHPEVVAAAYRAVLRALELEPVQRGEHTILPNYSHALDAAKMVFDRVDPRVERQERTIDVHVHPVSLDDYVIDVTDDSNPLANSSQRGEIPSDDGYLLDGPVKQDV